MKLLLKSIVVNRLETGKGEQIDEKCYCHRGKLWNRTGNAKLLAKDADHIVLVARNLTRLTQAKEVLITMNPNLKISLISADLSTIEGIRRCIEQIEDLNTRY